MIRIRIVMEESLQGHSSQTDHILSIIWFGVIPVSWIVM